MLLKSGGGWGSIIKMQRKELRVSARLFTKYFYQYVVFIFPEKILHLLSSYLIIYVYHDLTHKIFQHFFFHNKSKLSRKGKQYIFANKFRYKEYMYLRMP